MQIHDLLLQDKKDEKIGSSDILCRIKKANGLVHCRRKLSFRLPM